MSFDLDDPLGDLLSDGSNDSFFGETPKKSTVSNTNESSGAKKEVKVTTSTPKNDSKSKMDELFGIKETKIVDTPRGTPKMSRNPEKPLLSTQSAGSLLKKSQTFDKDDDILSDLGFDVNVKPKQQKSHSKASILDDILGGPLTAKEDFGVRPKTLEGTKSAPEMPTSNKEISRQSTITSEMDSNMSENTVLGGYVPNSRRQSGRRQSSMALNDPLGLFSKPEETKTATEPTLPPAKTVETKKIEEISKVIPVPAPRQDQTIDIDNKAQILAISASETNNALASLKQQEMSLAVAAQMKAQEIALTDMQQRQETLLRQQEQQFNELLQKQLQRQGALEENIKRQQERINAHINLLMTQPAAIYATELSTTDDNSSSTSDDEKHKPASDLAELKSEIKQLELEKLRLEDLLSNINANHENEIVFMENSYKKQLKLLEESLQKTETRLRAENKSLQDYYFAKIDDIEAEKQHLLDESKAKINSAKEEYERNIKEIRKKYEDDLQTMEQNYKDMIQNIRQSKLLEFSVVQENGNYLETLRNASKVLENANEGLGTLKIDLHEKIEKVCYEKESELKMREHKVEQAEKIMQKERENAEKERTRLLELVASLEIKLGSLEQTANEDNWNVKQKLTALEVERAAFEREKAFMRDQITREQKRLEEMKQLQSLEYDRTMKQIEEERMNLITEKAKIETNLRLQKRPDTHTSRAEIEAALKVAEEAGRQADIERERLIDVQRQYETKRRELSKEEHSMRAKQLELEEAINVAKAKEKMAETSLKNVKTLERNILIKLQVLQRHKKELHERESKLSIEKLNLSRERMQLDNVRRKQLDNRCSLCKIGEKSMEISNLLSTTTPNDNIPEQNIFDTADDDIDVDLSLNKLRHENEASNWEIDLNGVPNIGDASDNLLDADLLLLKFDILNSSMSVPNMAFE
ncbi:cingulin-like protein 1 [Culicoides brevitarsis]|uniref:cingulin-like protein 1 n=1 Tax=Culicoides brevitarsis TaxID=469753 RepID=UPI00307B9C67